MTGRVWKVGDDVDTDALAPGIYMRAPLDELARHCLESVDPAFAAGVQPGDVVVAGRNFGMGSSREQAAQALTHLGVRAVVDRSFGGIFFRNAYNLGLLALVCDETGKIETGHIVEIDESAGRIRNLTTGGDIACEPVPDHLRAVVAAGGLVPWLEKRREQRP